MAESDSLCGKTCIPCQGGVAPMSLAEAQAQMPAVPGWQLIDAGGKLFRRFAFDDFRQAEAFARKIGDIAESQNHHPVISYSWGYCEVVFYTHKIGGLHENDYIMAAKVNLI